MKKTLLSTVALALLICGCAYHQVFVEVDAKRIEVESSQFNGPTATQAADAFRAVADELGFQVDPVQTNAAAILYTAHAPDKNRINSPSLSLWIDDKQISFVSNLYRNDASENFAAAENAAILFERELDKRHIGYKVAERHETPLGP
jgi:apolipoprotein N-acyltransferase